MQDENKYESVVTSKKLGEWEKEFVEGDIIRVHKSYMVNMDYITEFNTRISLRGVSDKIPVGRKYKSNSRERYNYYSKNK